MTVTRRLNILQYNVRNDRITTMIPLLAEAATQIYNIIAIQEPWKNPHVATTLSSHHSGFHFLYRPGGDTRVCFYVNSRIDPDSWEVAFPTADLCTLSIRLCIGSSTTLTHIHNIYNPCPGSYSTITAASTVPAIRAQIESLEGEHIVLGDFNLHHPFWSGPSRPTQHAAADALLDLVDDHKLSLTLPAGTVTWEARGSQSTIDLVFMSEGLAERLIKCGAAPHMNQSSDHIPIVTVLTLESTPVEVPRRRAWKLLDPEKVRTAEKSAPPQRNPTTRAEVDQQLKEIEAFLFRVIDAAVPWARPSVHAKPFWSPECAEATTRARSLRRAWSTSGDINDWVRYAKATATKKKIIHKAKTRHFREEMAKATNDPKGLWSLAKWAKEKSQTAKELPKMPSPTKDNQTASTFEEKADMLRKKFFPTPPPADLQDIVGALYPPSRDCPAQITLQEVLETIRRAPADKAPGPDGISNRVLKACAATVSALLTPVYQACVDLAYHPKAFKIANTVALKKPGKDDYTNPKAYRPIALLNTMGKVLESIMSKKITHLAETHKLLPETHMGARRGESTETALEMLTEQVHTVWGQRGDKVASLLSIDVAGAFDTVSHPRLIHNLRKRHIPQWIANWVESFLNNRRTNLILQRRATPTFETEVGIPQGSPISPVLYLFYNADLLDICNRIGTNTSGLGFVDDVNVLAYGRSTEENCLTLEKVHKACEKWARRHGSVFAPAKYELIHLSRSPKRFNMAAVVRISNDTVRPKPDIRVLGLQIDTKLKWGPHIRRTQEKMAKQSLALTKLTTSTWGASFAKARQVYSMVIRPLMTYGSAVWHTPKEIKNAKTSTNKLTVMQNKCLRVIAGAYRATPVPVLEVETHIPPIDVHLDRLQAKARLRMRVGGQAKVIRDSCRIIADRLRAKTGRRRTNQKSTPGVEKAKWAADILRNIDSVPPPTMNPPWVVAAPKEIRRQREYAAFRSTSNRRINDRAKTRWKAQWTTYQQKQQHLAPAQTGDIDAKRLKLHERLKRAKSSLATQIRSGK